MKKSVKENEYAYETYQGQKVSKNQRAKEIMGYRNEGHPGANALFFPAELGYACPVCGFENLDMLEWSEYAGFIWCPKCNLDIPSCLCVKYSEPRIGQEPLSKKDRIIRATEIFLRQIEDALRRQSYKRKASLPEPTGKGNEAKSGEVDVPHREGEVGSQDAQSRIKGIPCFKCGEQLIASDNVDFFDGNGKLIEDVQEIKCPNNCEWAILINGEIWMLGDVYARLCQTGRFTLNGGN